VSKSAVAFKNVFINNYCLYICDVVLGFKYKEKKELRDKDYELRI
jgi:hypothetical protein